MAQELGHHGVTQAFDVHDGASAEVAELFREAGGAGVIDAAPVHFAFGSDQRRLAAWAVRGEDDWLVTARVARILHNFGDFGNDVAAALDRYEVADAHAETGNLVGVVERGAGDGCAGDEDGREVGDGSEFAGTADLEEDTVQSCEAGAGGEFVSDGPAWGFACEAEAALLRGGVQLDDDAVDLVGEGVAERLRVVDEGDDIIDRRDGGELGIDPHAGEAERGEGFGLKWEEGVAGMVAVRAREQEVGVKVKASLGDDVGFEGADGAGGGVTGVGLRGLALGFELGVHGAEGRLGHDTLTADFKGLRQVGGFQLGGGDVKRDGSDGADVRGDVLADGAIAAGEAAEEVGTAFGICRVVKSER